ncbi:unnamed protein product, partial [Staurois parvus]
QWRDWQREGWRTLSGGRVEGLAERGGGVEDTEWRDWHRGMEDTVEASGGIGREGWRTLSGGQWRDW